MSPDEAATRRVGGIVKWLKQRAAEHDTAAAQLGPNHPAGQEHTIRASECRAVAEQIARFWT